MIFLDIFINPDIRKYKTKDIGNFSFQQAGFLALGAGVAFLTYKLTSSIEVALIPLLLIIAFGFLKPYGMTCSQFLRTVGKEKLSPSVHYYETDFVYDFDEIQKAYGDDYHLVTDEQLIQSAGNNNKSNQDECVIYR